MIDAVALPRGTVTMLFSDMEGSTALLSRLGDDYAAILDSQRQIQRAAWTDHEGVEMGTEGDSFYTVFASAVAAVRAAVAAQRGLAARQWPIGVSVNVRMGLHTGSPSIHDGAYIGLDVHRAARIASAAHGGQVLLSASTAELVADALPDGVTLHDLGRHSLKDMVSPVRLVQLTISGLPSDFPRPRTLGSETSLPSAGNSLVGRDADLVHLGTLLTGSRDRVRLVTLTGPGGSGKTRLAAAVAERLVDHYPDGVFFVPLATHFTAEALWASIGEALDLPVESRQRQRVLDAITGRRLLLVLDNLEQIPTADAVIAQLLDTAAHVTILATTRRVLRLRHEHEYPVHPLDLPRIADADPTQSGAVALFVAQAQRVRPTFALTAANLPDVIRLCRSLDGLPLAIELAAARSKLLSPRALLSRIDRRLDVSIAAVDRPARHQTLRQTIDWSYELLSDDEQDLLRTMGIFAGGADLDAIEAIAERVHGVGAMDVLTVVGDLVDASLITIVETEGDPRITLLETVRVYARDKLSGSQDHELVAQAHAEYYRSLVATLYEQSLGGEQRRSRARFVAEHENIVAALQWALAEIQGEAGPGDLGRIRLGVGLCADSLTTWARESHVATARKWAGRAIDLSSGHDWIEAATCRIRWANFLCQAGGEVEGAALNAKASIELLGRIGGIDHMPDAMRTLGWVQLERGDLDGACAYFDEALKRGQAMVSPAAHVRYVIRFCHMAIGSVHAARSSFDEALTCFAAQETSARADLDFEDSLAAQHNTACTLRLMGRTAEAVQHFQRIIPLSFEMNQVFHLVVLCEDYAAALAETGALASATRLIGGADQLRIVHALNRSRARSSELEPTIAVLKAGLGDEDWATNFAIGMATPIDLLLSRAA